MGAAVLVNGRSEDYFKGREEIIDILEKRANKSIATLKGDHKECIVVVNLVADTTLSSNNLSNTYDGIQAFGYDLWRSCKWPPSYCQGLIKEKSASVSLWPELCQLLLHLWRLQMELND